MGPVSYTHLDVYKRQAVLCPYDEPAFQHRRNHRHALRFAQNFPWNTGIGSALDFIQYVRGSLNTIAGLRFPARIIRGNREAAKRQK